MEARDAIALSSGALGAGLVVIGLPVASVDLDAAKGVLVAGGAAIGVGGLLAASDHPIAGAVALGVGALVMVGAFAGVAMAQNASDVRRVSQKSGNVDLGGGWTLLDVSSRTKETLARRSSLHQGDVAALLLNAGGLVNWPFHVEIIGGGGGDFQYSGSWFLKPPVGGPQLVAFGPEHVFQIA